MESYLACNKWDAGHDLGENLKAYMRWSRKPREQGGPRGYRDYREKIETYVDEVGGHAETVRPGILEAARAGVDPVVESQTRFHYLNTSVYRDGTRGIEKSIEEEVVGVIGVGGTGSYLVDVLAKTNIKELHLYDGQCLGQENGFRLAGAVRLAEFGKPKVEWHGERYSAVRRDGLVLHQTRVDEKNLEFLDRHTTVFVAVDDLPTRRLIQRACEEKGILHIAVGIGVDLEGERDEQLGAMVQVEIDYSPRPPREDEPDAPSEPMADVYKSNIQTAELNMLGAAIAIVEWKAKRRVYRSERTAGHDTTLYSATTGDILKDRTGT